MQTTVTFPFTRPSEPQPFQIGTHGLAHRWLRGAAFEASWYSMGWESAWAAGSM